MIRAACTLLMIFGMLSVFVALPSFTNPAATRCSLSRAWIERVNEDDKDFNDVEMDGREPDDLECEEANRIAGRIRIDEDSDDRLSVPAVAAIRTRSGLTTLVGLGQAITGLVTRRTLDRRARTVALVFTAFGVLFSIFGILSVPVLLFVVYALAFSQPSREVWGGGDKPGPAP